MKTKTANKNEGAFNALTFCMIVIVIMLIMSFATCNDAKAQDQDSVTVPAVRAMMITPEQAIGFMSQNFVVSHREFKFGWITAASGSALMISSALMNNNLKTSDPRIVQSNPLKQITAIVGGTAIIAGLIIVIDSHGAFRNAGRIRLTADGLVLILDK